MAGAHSPHRHCEPTGRREAPPDDKLREAIQLYRSKASWIASSQALLAMTNKNNQGEKQ
jgi:hypothetical protein